MSNLLGRRGACWEGANKRLPWHFGVNEMKLARRTLSFVSLWAVVKKQTKMFTEFSFNSFPEERPKCRSKKLNLFYVNNSHFIKTTLLAKVWLFLSPSRAHPTRSPCFASKKTSKKISSWWWIKSLDHQANIVLMNVLPSQLLRLPRHVPKSFVSILHALMGPLPSSPARRAL